MILSSLRIQPRRTAATRQAVRTPNRVMNRNNTIENNIFLPFYEPKILNPYNQGSNTTANNHKTKTNIQVTNIDTPQKTSETTTPLKTKLRQTTLFDDSQQDNLKNNDSHGDSIEEKIDGTARFILNNIKGIRPLDNYAQSERIGNQSAKYKANVICLPGTDYRWEDPVLASKVYQKIRKQWKPMAAAPSSAAKHTSEGTYQPGGTCTMVQGFWTSYVKTKESDTSGMGRWSSVTMQGKEDIKITTICGYRAPETSITSAGDSTAWKTQWSVLRARGTPNPTHDNNFSTIC